MSSKKTLNIVTLEEAEILAQKEATKIGMDIVKFVKEDKRLGFVFYFMMKDGLSDRPTPTGLPFLEGLKNGKFEPIRDAELIFNLLGGRKT